MTGPVPAAAFEMRITPTPEGHDSDRVTWLLQGVAVGHGYRSKNDGSLHVTRCPSCRSENYALRVAAGDCAWCGFDPAS